MNVRPRLLFACVLLLGATAFARPPNFVVILADDLGYGDLGCYGGTGFATPHLDALAAAGLRFTDFHSNGPVCSPTRAALLTGRYQQRSGITGVVFADPARGHREDHGLDPTETTFARLLRAAGYQTGLMGKWHLGYAKRFNPLHHGFDEFRGYVSGNIDFHSHVDGAGFPDWWHDLELRDEPGYVTHLITRHAVRFLEENRARPFCLYIAHEAPHYPYQGPNDPPLREPGRTPVAETYPPGHVARAYREMVEEMDRGIGEIIATLERLGLGSDTLVFFCSDNGATPDGSNSPWRGHKGGLWEGGHRVPAIAAWPGRIAPGTTDATALTMDLMPTVLELAGIEPPPGRSLDGTSLAGLLLRREPLPARTLFWSYSERAAVRDGAWKLLVGEGEQAPASLPRLFHLESDPGETRDLAQNEPGRRAEMLAALERWRREVAPR